MRLAREELRREHLLQVAAQNSDSGWGGTVLPGSLSSLPWASRPNLDQNRTKHAQKERPLLSSKAAKAPVEQQDPEERARRRAAWEALTDRPDVDSFLAASRGPRQEKASASTGLRISLATLERAALVVARPKAAAAPPAEEAQAEEAEEAEEACLEGRSPSEDSGRHRRSWPSEARAGGEDDSSDEPRAWRGPGRREGRREERRKREDWRKRWREEKAEREDERRRQGLRELQRRKRGAPSERSSGSSSSPRERPRRRREVGADSEAATRRASERFLAVMTQASDKAAATFSGQVSDAELEKRLRTAQSAASSEGPLMSEEQVLAKLQKARSRGMGRRE